MPTTFEETLKNSLPGSTGGTDTNINSFANADDLSTQVDDPTGNSTAFNHLARLADKLENAVVVDISAALEKSIGQPNSVSTAKAKPIGAYLPPKVASWVERNMQWLYAAALIAVVFMFASVLRVVRR